MSFERYKAKLRRKSTIRKMGADHSGYFCRNCQGQGPGCGDPNCVDGYMREFDPFASPFNDCSRCGKNMGTGPCGFDKATQKPICLRCWQDDHPAGLPAHPNIGFDIPRSDDHPLHNIVPNDERWSNASGSDRLARLSGMDDPTPDPSFDAERADMPEQKDADRQRILDGLEAIRPGMEEFMRTRGINEPDWEPLERTIPPSHLGDWMWMGYGTNGQREYKHWATRRYLNLIPQEELQPGYEGPGMDHLLKRRDIPFHTFLTRDGREVHQPVDMDWAVNHAYEDVDKLIGRNGELGTHPYPQGYPSGEWEHMEVSPWERPPYQQQEPGPSDFDPYADLR